MGLFDRIRKKHENVGKDKKTLHPAKALATPTKGDKEKPKPEEPTKPAERRLKGDTRHAYRVLLRPVLTEKSSRLQSKMNQYVFAVRPTASKVEVREAVHALYGIRPLHVTTRNVRGKVVRFGRLTGKQRSWKKAVVTLPAGKTIDVTA